MGLFSSGKSSNPGRVAEFALNGNPFFQAQVDATKGMDNLKLGATGDLKRLQNQLLQDAKLFNAMGVDNEGADLAQSLGMDFLSGIDAFDPMAIAEQQFNLLNPILAAEQEQQFLDMEGRLFRQGRLGGSGRLSGQSQMNALFDSQEDARRKLLADSFGMGLQAQAQQVNLGSSLLQLDPTLRGLFRGLGSASLSDSLNIQTTANDVFRALAGAQGGNASGGGGGSGNSLGGALMSGVLSGLTGGISSAVEGLF